MNKIAISHFKATPTKYFNEAEKEPVTITKHGKSTHVLITKKFYTYLINLRKKDD